MAAVRLVGAEADDHEDASAVQRAHEQGHEVERRPIRPVQILDHEHERAVGGEPLDHAAASSAAVSAASSLSRPTKTGLTRLRRIARILPSWQR
jgi:hypothetical protein